MTSTVQTTEVGSDRVFVAAQIALLVHVAALVLAFDPQLFDAFALIKSALAEVTAAVLAALLLWLVIRHGRAVLGWTPMHLLVGAVVVVFAASALFALQPDVAAFGMWRRYLGLTHLLDCAVVYLGAVVLVRSRQAVSLALVFLLGVTFLVVAYGTLQALHLDPIRYAQDTSRPISTLGNPDILSGFLSVTAATFGAVGLLYWRRLPRALAIAFIVCAAWSVVILGATTVRNGLLGIAAGVVAALVLVLLGMGSRRIATAVLASLLVVAVIVVLSPLGARLSPSYLANDASVASRIEIWRSALVQFQDRPLLGVGPDNFGVAWYTTRTPRSEGIYGPEIDTSPHSWLFYYLTSAGIIGLAVFLALIAFAFVAAARLARRGDPLALAAVPLAAYLGQGLVNVNDVSLDWIAYLAVGLLAGATAAPIAVRRAKRRRALGEPNLVGWIGVAVVALAMIVGQYPRVAANLAETRALGYLGVGGQIDAIAPAAEAVRLDPRRAEYWSTLGTAYAALNLGSALSAFLEASRLAPYDRTHWIDITIEQRAAGNKAGALKAAQRAVESDPSSSEARKLVASVYLDLERFDDAAREGETAISLFPAPQNFEEPILAYIKLEKWDKAIALSQQALTKDNSPHYHLRLAQSYTGAGRYAEAKQELALVLKATPDDPEARDLATFLATKT